LPGIVAFYGHSGWGKTTSAAYAANKTRAFHVAVKESWTRKAFVTNILIEMAIEPAKTVYAMVDQVAENLMLYQRPLIIDEFDHVVNRGMVELVRDIYESSSAPILIIGEERLETKLRKFERFHNRILEWVPAQPASIDDAKALAKLYCRDAKLADDLIKNILALTRGCVRRICVNLENVRAAALRNNWDVVDLDLWGNREIYTGHAAARRM
jgi:DNA transposition AAA+ family ATPase